MEVVRDTDIKGEMKEIRHVKIKLEEIEFFEALTLGGTGPGKILRCCHTHLNTSVSCT